MRICPLVLASVARVRNGSAPRVMAGLPHVRGRVRTAVHEKFPLSVVYLTTDAMTSIALMLTIEVSVAIAFAAAWFTWQQVGESRAV